MSKSHIVFLWVVEAVYGYSPHMELNKTHSWKNWIE